MYYTSTRDSTVKVSSAEAVLKTIAESDGGLFVPSEIPAFTAGELQEMCDLSYCEVSMRVLAKFLPDFEQEEIEYMVLKAYRGKYHIDDSTPMHQLEKDTFALELWHSPTFSYKDFSMQLLPHLMKAALKKLGLQKEIALVIATSGDSGKAGLAGFGGVSGTKAIVFYPQNTIGDLHRKWLTTQEAENVAVYGVEGDFLEAQRQVRSFLSNKDILEDLYQKGILCTSANSLNWGRLLPNIIYYVFAYLRLLKRKQLKAGETVAFSLSTGNFGSAMAGYYAREMGIPIEKLICVAGKNRSIVDFIKLGQYQTHRETQKSITPSVDGGQGSNIERLLFHISGNDSRQVKFYIGKLIEKGYFYIPQELLSKVKEVFKGGSQKESVCRNVISDIYNDNFYLMDPHTALQLCVLEQKKPKLSAKAYVVISTANPFAYCKDVMYALNDDTEEMDEFDTMEFLSDKTGIDCPEELYALKKKNVRFKEIIKVQDIPTAILKALE